MVKGKIKQREAIERPSVNYRKLDSLNQSMIALFDENPVRFFREYKMGEARKPKESTALIIGDLVDFHLLECGGDEEVFESRFDEKFALMDGNKGGGQVFELADVLFSLTIPHIQEDGTVSTSFTTRFEDAYNIVTSKGMYSEKKSPTGSKSISTVLEDFEKNGRDYFQMKMDNIGKIVVGLSLLDKARTIVQALKSDTFTSSIFLQYDGIDYLPKYPIEWKYKIDHEKYIDCKSEIDLLKVNHVTKKIELYDLKTTYDNESFEFSYIKNYYYIQLAFYTMAVEEWKKENGLEGYEVVNMKFIVGDTSANNRRPLVYQTNQYDMSCGKKGFTMRGTYYRGVDDLIKEITWCEETNQWNVSKEAFDNKGQMKLNINYD